MHGKIERFITYLLLFLLYLYFIIFYDISVQKVDLPPRTHVKYLTNYELGRKTTE